MSSWTAVPLPARLAGSRGPPFVGRLPVLAVLDEVWASVLDGDRQVVFVGGEPGIGKTRLAAEAAVTLHDHGAAVLWGASHADLEVPYRPFVSALDELFGATPPGALEPLLGDSAVQLLRLTDGVRRHRPDLADDEPDRTGSHVALFDAVLDLLVALAERQPLVVVLEDLHWTSAQTMRLLTHVVQATARTRLLLLVTHRTTLPDRSDELTYAIADLYRLDGVTRVDLSGLETAEVTEYLVRSAGLSPSTARSHAAVLRDQTAGNAFFLHELWRDLSHRGGIEALRSPGFHAPQSVQDTVHRRLAQLDPRHVEVVELAAVAGDSVELPVLVEAAEQPAEVALEAIDLCVAAGLLVAGGHSTGRYRFAHALVRQAILDRMLPSRHLGDHARLGLALERQRTDDPLVVVRMAHHFDRAAPLGHAERAARHLVTAGHHARRGLAHQDAAERFARAAELTPDGHTRAELLLAAAQDHLRAGDFDRARQLYEPLAGSGDPTLRLRAAIGYEDASWRPGLQGGRAVQLLEEALRAVPDDPDDLLQVRALASLGRAASFTGDRARAMEVGERALDLARRAGDDELLAPALGTTLWWGMTPDLAPRLLVHAAELADVARRMRSDDHLGVASLLRALFAYIEGDVAEWATARQDLATAARAGGQPFHRYMSACAAYAHRFAAGDLESARDTLVALGELGTEFGPDATEGSHGIQTFMLKQATGELEEVRPLISGSEDPVAHWAPGLLSLYCELDLRAPATRVLAHLLALLDQVDDESPVWTAQLVAMTDAAVHLEQPEVAGQLRPLLAAHQGRNLVAGQFVAVFGSADRQLGRVDSLLGDPDAESRFEAALEMDRRMGAVTHQIETLVAWSQHVHRHGGTRGAARAGQLAAEARALAERIGHRGALRRLGPGSSPPPRRELPDGLTQRELEVLGLVAEGLANREIGERLFISQNTAANHVRNILMKTGAANRTQAAIYAADRGLL